MSNNYSNPVKGQTGTLNLGHVEPGFSRTESILTVERFKQEYLFGIPLRSSLTGEEVSEETLKNFLSKGISDFETSVKIPVSPVVIRDVLDFERADDLAFSTRQLSRYPVLEVQKLQACFPGRMSGEYAFNADPENDPFNDEGSQVVTYPTNWIELNSDNGLIRITPKTGSLVNADVSFIASAGYKSILLGGLKSWPRLWRITYRVGFEEDKIPAIVNDLIGIKAAIKLLSQIGPVLFPAIGYGVGLDGMSQSVTTPGPQFLAGRLADLKEQEQKLEAQMKSYFGQDLIFGVF